METIFRVKRKKDDEPVDALFIVCKRSKTESDERISADSVTALIKLTATVEKQEDNVKEHIQDKSTKEELKENFKRHIVDDIHEKLREKHKQSIRDNRLKIVNSKRGINNVNIIDIENENAVTSVEETQYVYDLYLSTADEDLPLDDLEMVEAIGEELVFEDCYKDDSQHESEDSNSESNWRNDYPDSEHSEGSVTEDLMVQAMENMNLDNELSSDEDFVYGLDETDVERYGHKYAKWKAKIKKNNFGISDDDDDDEDDDEADDNEDDVDNENEDEDDNGLDY